MCFQRDCNLLCGRTGTKQKKNNQSPAFTYPKKSLLLDPDWAKRCFWRCHSETIQQAKVRVSGVSWLATFTKSPDCKSVQIGWPRKQSPAAAKLHRVADETACLIYGSAADLCGFQKHIRHEPFTKTMENE
jgi:hypothetical protein